jgi:uncharacterized small protein (DUF1192 family)
VARQLSELEREIGAIRLEIERLKRILKHRQGFTGKRV